MKKKVIFIALGNIANGRLMNIASSVSSPYKKHRGQRGAVNTVLNTLSQRKRARGGRGSSQGGREDVHVRVCVGHSWHQVPEHASQLKDGIYRYPLQNFICGVVQDQIIIHYSYAS